MFRPTRIEISKANLIHNLGLLKSWNGYAFFCPMVKANAYGHGEEIVAKIVEEFGVDAMGVAYVEEGKALREAGIQAPILTFAPLGPEGAAEVIRLKLTPVVGRFEDLEALLAHKPKELKIHLKFNTGMQRIGFDEEQLPALKEWLKKHPNFEVTGTCTHLTHGEEADQPEGPSQRQFKKFLKLCQDFPGVRHAHKSASLAAQRESKNPSDVGARPGIGIYGLPHEGNLIGAGLKPVLRWVTGLAYVHNLKKGESVSYGAQWTAARPSVIGVLPVGYGDGYRRALSNKAQMLFRGQRIPVVGRVCMDYTLVDLTDALKGEAPRSFEPVVILGRDGGEEISAYEISTWAETNAYEVVTAISRRVAREVK